MKEQLESFGAKVRALRDAVESPELRHRLREMDRRLGTHTPCGRAASKPVCERWQAASVRKRPV